MNNEFFSIYNEGTLIRIPYFSSIYDQVSPRKIKILKIQYCIKWPTRKRLKNISNSFFRLKIGHGVWILEINENIKSSFIFTHQSSIKRTDVSCVLCIHPVSPCISSQVRFSAFPWIFISSSRLYTGVNRIHRMSKLYNNERYIPHGNPLLNRFRQRQSTCAVKALADESLSSV